MPNHSNIIKYFLAVFILASLTACAPLSFTMYVRNITSGTTYLTMMYKADPKYTKKITTIKYADTVLAINRNTKNYLTGVLPLTTFTDDQMSVAIPPHATIYLRDMVYAIDQFAYKTLIFKNATYTDTVRFNYPYRRIKGVKHKRRTPFNIFYRTILYSDVKEK